MDLVLENLVKRFGERIALEIPKLTIHRGEFFTLVGPSGCGKSTTLNLIAGLEEVSDGTLRLGERVLNELPPHRRDIAFVFQSYALYPHRTVFGNLAFPLELGGAPLDEIRRRVAETAELLGLTALLEKRPRQLSGGERQRVALGRAMVRQPQLFLFDEPLSNLDAPLQTQMRRELRRLHRQLGTTFVYVTHDQEEALSMSDRVAVMQAGRIRQCGTPREVYEQPVNIFVATFFGSPPMNLLPANLERDAEGAWARVGAWRLPARICGEDRKTDAVTLGIRPEHLRLSREPAADAWPLQVTLCEPHGALIHLELEGDGIHLTAAERGQAGYALGEKVWVQPVREWVHVFDQRTGERIGGGET